MSTDSVLPRTSAVSTPWESIARVSAVLVLLFLFLLGVRALGEGFKLLGSDLLQAFFLATANPFVGLMVGILATTLVQSSSVTTSMVVALVAAPENPLPIANAVPMIMGANIGTTVTNTIVSLAHIGRRDEFYRAFSVATCHDFFNFIAVAVLLPLELLTGYLRETATTLSAVFGNLTGVKYQSPLKGALKAAYGPIDWLAESLFSSGILQAILVILIAGTFIFFALFSLVRVLRALMQARVEAYLTSVLGRSALLSMGIGVLVTVMVQSSSITTSLLVPLAGAGLITLQHAFPITIGANIGTTVTALLASMAASGDNAQAGVIIALVHLLFNLSGTVLIYPLKVIRQLPLIAAERMAHLAVNARRWAVVYVVVIFYGLPAAAALLDRLLR